MKRIETGNWVPDENRAGRFAYVGQRKMKDVFKELIDILKEEMLYPDEYLLLGRELDRDEIECPKIDDMFCYVRWGSNEGIYLDIDIRTFDEKSKKSKTMHFATGKTLGESENAFDKMQYIAGYIYRLFMGNGTTPSRYIILSGRNPAPTQESIVRRAKEELVNFLKLKLYHSEEDPKTYADEISLKFLIYETLTRCQLSEEKVQELHKQDKILDCLYDVCSSVLSANMYEIEDVIVSCRSFRYDTDL